MLRSEMMRIAAMSCVLVFGDGVGGLSLEKYSKGLAWFSSLVEKGFPGYFLCTCACIFFLLSWFPVVVMVELIVDLGFQFDLHILI
jgi:hypothetical protein